MMLELFKLAHLGSPNPPLASFPYPAPPQCYPPPIFSNIFTWRPPPPPIHLLASGRLAFQLKGLLVMNGPITFRHLSNNSVSVSNENVLVLNTSTEVPVLPVSMDSVPGTNTDFLRRAMSNSTIAPATDDNIIPTFIRWVFIILLVVYAWQALWMLYGLTTIWRKTSYGYLYVAPGYMHPSVYWCFCGTNLSSVATILLVHYNLGIFALSSTVVAMVFVYISLFMSLRRVYIRAPVLIRELRSLEVWCARLFVQNGLASYATWLTYVALFHMAYVLTEVFDVFRELSVTIAVNIIFLEIIVWFFLDNITFDKFTRYTVSPYVISILTLVSVLAHSEFSEFSNSNSVMVGFMLITNCIGLLLKLVILFFKHVKYPLFSNVGFSATKKNYGTLDYTRLPPDNERRTLL